MFALKIISCTGRAAGVLLIAAGIAMTAAMLIPQHEEKSFDEQLQALGDHDYGAEARKLFAQKKYEETKVLCEDMIACDTPGAKAAVLLKTICENKTTSPAYRAKNAFKAFITGNSSGNFGETAAAMLSDMMMYGDLRDLAVQGYFSITGRKSDPLVAAIAGAGLLTEFADAVDWTPALLKALRKSSALSGALCRNLLKLIKTNGLRSQKTRRVFSGIKLIFDRGGLVRAKNILRHIDKTDDVCKMAELSEKSISAASLFARSAGKNTAKAAEKLLKENSSAAFLKRLIRKGPHGVTLFLRSAKTVKKGNAEKLLSTAVQILQKKFGNKVFFIPAILILSGTILLFRRSSPKQKK